MQLSTLNPSLLGHFFELLADYRSVEAIDRDACLAVARRRQCEASTAFHLPHSPCTGSLRRYVLS
jgi:hypothetical protein